jgi:hypothetical protein
VLQPVPQSVAQTDYVGPDITSTSTYLVDLYPTTLLPNYCSVLAILTNPHATYNIATAAYMLDSLHTSTILGKQDNSDTVSCRCVTVCIIVIGFMLRNMSFPPIADIQYIGYRRMKAHLARFHLRLQYWMSSWRNDVRSKVFDGLYVFRWDCGQVERDDVVREFSDHVQQAIWA